MTIAVKSSSVSVPQHTPDNISELPKNSVFVFGSNLAGRHFGGAAKVALELFGAVWGAGEGITGQSYAFPTLDYDMSKLDRIELEASARNLQATAESLPAVTFYLTKVGCGIAGYPEDQMKALFTDMPRNIIKPKGW